MRSFLFLTYNWITLIRRFPAAAYLACVFFGNYDIRPGCWKSFVLSERRLLAQDAGAYCEILLRDNLTQTVSPQGETRGCCSHSPSDDAAEARSEGLRLFVCMGTITAIEVQKKNPRRVSIYLDGEFAFGLARTLASRLEVGQTLHPADIERLQAQDLHERAWQQAMLLLRWRARSEAEVRSNLEKHHFPPTVIQHTLERLRAQGFLNDRRFAQEWVANRNEFRPRSRKALTFELRCKGLSESDIQAAIEAVDEETLARAAAQAWLRRLERQSARTGRTLEWHDFRKKLGDFLARRGFAHQVIALTVKRLWLERHDRQTFDDEETA